MNDYVESLARRVLGDNPFPEFAAAIVDGTLLMTDMDDWLAALIGADVSPDKVEESWERAGCPEYHHYLPGDYAQNGIVYWREQTANARASAIADCVTDALVDIVVELVGRGDWEAIPCEKFTGQPGWFTDAGHLFGLETQSGYLVPTLSE